MFIEWFDICLKIRGRETYILINVNILFVTKFQSRCILTDEIIYPIDLFRMKKESSVIYGRYRIYRELSALTEVKRSIIFRFPFQCPLIKQIHAISFRFINHIIFRKIIIFPAPSKERVIYTRCKFMRACQIVCYQLEIAFEKILICFLIYGYKSIFCGRAWSPLHLF